MLKVTGIDLVPFGGTFSAENFMKHASETFSAAFNSFSKSLMRSRNSAAFSKSSVSTASLRAFPTTHFPIEIDAYFRACGGFAKMLDSRMHTVQKGSNTGLRYGNNFATRAHLFKILMRGSATLEPWRSRSIPISSSLSIKVRWTGSRGWSLLGMSATLAKPSCDLTVENLSQMNGSLFMRDGTMMTRDMIR